jgi:hypothetical protein
MGGCVQYSVIVAVCELKLCPLENWATGIGQVMRQ